MKPNPRRIRCCAIIPAHILSVVTNLDLPKDVTFVLWPFVFLFVGIALCAFIVNRSGNDPRERVLFDTAVCSSVEGGVPHYRFYREKVEGMTGIEPASSAWKAEVLATIRHSHNAKSARNRCGKCSAGPE